MTSVAILIGNAHYKSEPKLDCCLDDLRAIEQLVAAIGRYDIVKAAADADADGMRDAIRGSLAEVEHPEDILFYFSGHGAQVATEFYFCGTGFDPLRPNETGLSHGELHEMLRAAEPGLLVKIVDACASGTPLIKMDLSPSLLRKDGLRNVIQLSSCLQDQASWGGNPLSEFTRAFCSACLRRVEGPVYYTDIVNTLRDDFLGDQNQTPHFVSQGTGREFLVDNAAKLAPFREHFEQLYKEDEDLEGRVADPISTAPATPPTILELLREAERKMVTPDRADRLISTLLDGVSQRLTGGELSELFTPNVQEHASFEEQIARDFVARTLAKEARPDDLVRAEVRNVPREAPPIERSLLWSSLNFYGYEEQINLRLNCTLSRAQLKVTLTPKFQSLQRMVLVLTCAPSLEYCYVFELLTRHQRSDWDKFSDTGSEVVRRWYKLTWEQETSFVVQKICATFEEAVRRHIETTAERLAKT